MDEDDEATAFGDEAPPSDPLVDQYADGPVTTLVYEDDQGEVFGAGAGDFDDEQDSGGYEKTIADEPTDSDNRSFSPYDGVLFRRPPPSDAHLGRRADPARQVSVFDTPEHIADKLWSADNRTPSQSPYNAAVAAARVLAKLPDRAPSISVRGGGSAVTPRPTPTPSPPGSGAALGALAGAAGFLGLVGGLAYVALRQGDTYEERTRRRIFARLLLDQGLIDHEEYEEYVRSGNLPERVADKVAVRVLPERGDVDLWQVATAGVTATGQPRDARTFWRLYIEQKGNLGLSSDNLALIGQGRSPRVDPMWVKAYPEHHGFEGRRLDHHHIEGTSIATPVPDLLHRWLTKSLHPYLH